MSDEISWHVELAVRPDALEKFRALTDQMVEFARNEAGVMIYERFISEDGVVVHVYERYSDSVSAEAHLEAFGKRFGERFASMVERKRFTVCGTPSDALRATLDAFGATEYVNPFAGFSRPM